MASSLDQCFSKENIRGTDSATNTHKIKKNSCRVTYMGFQGVLWHYLVKKMGTLSLFIRVSNVFGIETRR